MSTSRRASEMKEQNPRPGDPRPGDPRPADPWRTNPRLNGDETGFRYGTEWIDFHTMSERPDLIAPSQRYDDGRVVVTDQPRRGDESPSLPGDDQTAHSFALEDTGRVSELPSERVYAHGTRARYNQGCTDGPDGKPCAPCRRANAAYMKRYRKGRAS